MSTPMETNTEGLQEILNEVYNLPDRNSGGNVDDSPKYDYTKQGLPILYLTGDTTGMDKDNAKDMSYVFGERSGTCSVKWQGSGSVTLGQEMGTQFFADASKGHLYLLPPSSLFCITP